MKYNFESTLFWRCIYHWQFFCFVQQFDSFGFQFQPPIPHGWENRLMYACEVFRKNAGLILRCNIQFFCVFFCWIKVNRKTQVGMMRCRHSKSVHTEVKYALCTLKNISAWANMCSSWGFSPLFFFQWIFFINMRVEMTLGWVLLFLASLRLTYLHTGCLGWTETVKESHLHKQCKPKILFSLE